MSRRCGNGLPNLYMEFFEKLAMETQAVEEVCFDTFCIHRKGSAEERLVISGQPSSSP